MIARLLSAAMRAVDAGGGEPRRKIGRQHQEVHAKARVAPERGVVYPKRIDAFFGMQMPRRIDPSLLEQPAKGRTRLGPDHGVFAPEPLVVYVGLGRNHVEIAREHRGLS